MFSAIRFIMTVIGLILIALNLATVAAFTKFEGLVRVALARQSEEVFNTDVRIEKVRVDWARQALEIRGISIDNPDGFSDREAIWVESAWLRPDPLTLFARTPTLEQLRVQGARLQLQRAPERGTNLGAITASVSNAAGRQATGDARVLGRRVVLKELVCDPVEIYLRDEAATEGAPVSLNLPAFAVEVPAEPGALSGCDTILLLLRGATRQMEATESLPDFMRETSNLEPGPVPATAGPGA